MLYRIQPDTTTPTISGRNLAHSKRSVPERAFIGADLHRNRVELVSPTMKQCARLAGVCIPYVTAAIDIIDDPDARDAVLRGDLNILDAAKRSHARENSRRPYSTLVAGGTGRRRAGNWRRLDLGFDAPAKPMSETAATITLVAAALNSDHTQEDTHDQNPRLD